MSNHPDNKKVQFRLAFREFAERFFDSEFRKLSSSQQTEGLTRYYIQEIYNKLNTPISSDDFESSYVDKSGDLGADFLYRDDGTVLIFELQKGL